VVAGSGSVRFLLAVVLSALLLGPVAGSSASSGSSYSRTAYAGLGTWLSIYAKKAWRDPEQRVAAMVQHGVRTLYLETGNYKQGADLVRPQAVGRFIDAAHAAGLRVVAWYLPSFANLQRDERRAVAAIRFRSVSGQRFDAFALDIEATVVRAMQLRNRRLLQLSARLRWDAGPGYALGAITPSPIGMSPSYWPDIPYRTLARYYAVFLPMAYSTDRGAYGSNATRSYLSATVAAIRSGTGNPKIPIHLIGGLSAAMGATETAGFMRAVAACAPLGYSLYAFPSTGRASWTALAAPLPAVTARDRRCA
jgi:hypothetical protein